MKLKVYVHTGVVGSRREVVVEVPDNVLQGMEHYERAEYLEKVARDEVDNMVLWGWDEV